jgi:hypothetical protein
MALFMHQVAHSNGDLGSGGSDGGHADDPQDRHLCGHRGDRLSGVLRRQGGGAVGC